MVDDPLWDGSTSSRISRNLLILLAFLKYVHTNKHENTTHMRTMVQWCWNIYNYIYHKKMTQIYVKSSSTMEHRFIKPCHVENLRCCHRPSLEPLPLATCIKGKNSKWAGNNRKQIKHLKHMWLYHVIQL